MGLFQALILGIVQGLTEFFPISSSAHLQIAKWFLGCENSSHFFDLVCHSGTLLALLFYLRKEVWDVLRSVRKIAVFTVALVPLVPAYFLLKPLRVAASDPRYLGYCLMFTGLLLFAACRKREVVWETGTGAGSPKKHLFWGGGAGGFGEWRDVLFIGVMQALALIPGISRSGSTIAAARFCGWEWKKAARFSFLLSIPAILGGQVLESAKFLKNPTESVEIYPLLLGFAASFGMGIFAVRFVFWIYEKEKVRPLAWYCLGIGLLAALFYGKAAA